MSKERYAQERRSYLEEVQRITNDNLARAAEQDACMNSGRQFACQRPMVALPEEFLLRPSDPQDPAPLGAGLPARTVAYAAVARLRLNPPEPTVGPPPSINEWKMAAVGYPLWFWVEGNLDPAPVSDTVYDLTVSLDARLEKVVFDLGDGNTMTCSDVSRKWTRAVEPGTPSPACGYRYTKPSLPKGKYTITANAVWAVDWSVNGTTGTIPVYQSATTTLPVGELQVLTR